MKNLQLTAISFCLLPFRHHTRFLPVDPKDRIKSGNAKPGLVVDNKIVSNFYYDFYLSAHYGALGKFRFIDQQFDTSKSPDR